MPCLHSCLLRRFNFTLNFLYFFPKSSAGGVEKGVWSIHHTQMFLPLLLPQEDDSSHFPLLQCGVTAMGDILLWTFPTWVLPTGWRPSQAVPVWVPSPVSRPSEAECSSLDPPWDHMCCRQTHSSMDFPLGHSPLQASSCSRVGPPRLQMDFFSTVNLHEPQERALLTMVFATGCRGTLFQHLEDLLLLLLLPHWPQSQQKWTIYTQSTPCPFTITTAEIPYHVSTSHQEGDVQPLTGK